MWTVQQFIDQARTYVNVKWKHQGRSREGVDCIGLFWCVATDLGMTVEDDRNYGHFPGSRRLIERILEECDDVPVATWTVGDLLLLSMRGEDPQHVLLVTDRGVLHASAAHRKVVEHGLDLATMNRVRKVFRPRTPHG